MDTSRPLKVLILGSTGSIGTSTLNCIRRFPHRFSVAGLAAGNNCALLIEQVKEFSPQTVLLSDTRGREPLRCGIPNTVRTIDGDGGLEKIVAETDCDIVVNALVGAVGLRPTIKAITLGKRVALANKESLVIGDLITALLKKSSGDLVPVDSEHSAILQSLAGAAPATVESIILTASGGPFRKLSPEAFATITPAAALNHPTWSMGRKITIDSATMMNKGFEVIEAHHLFAVPYSKLRVWIHPQSIIHSLVEFHDGAVLAQLGIPDMELPIQYALAYPERLPMPGKRLSLPELGALTFFEPDGAAFPCLQLCIDAGCAGGTAPAVVNAANEIAVSAFLDGQIRFTAIATVVATALEQHATLPADSLEVIEHADHEARLSATATISKKGLL